MVWWRNKITHLHSCLIQSLQALFCIDFWSQMSLSEKLMQRKHQKCRQKGKSSILFHKQIISYLLKCKIRFLITFDDKGKIFYISALLFAKSNILNWFPDRFSSALILMFKLVWGIKAKSIAILVICFWLRLCQKCLI